MTILTATMIAIGYGINMGLKAFFVVFSGYMGLKLARKVFGPIKLFTE